MESDALSWKANVRGVEGAEFLPAEFVEAYPTISEALRGDSPQSRGDGGIPPCTINLFVEGGRVKFVLIPKDWPRVAFGCLGDPVKGFDALESELVRGRVEWKKTKARR